LLEKAVEVIQEDGIGGLSLRDVARRAGVSHGAPAHHFTDKAGLLTALATRSMEQFGAILSEASGEAGGSALDRLRAIGPEFAASYQATFDLVKDAVCAAQGEGWRRSMDPMALVITCWSAVHGLSTLYLDGVLEDRMGPIDLETAAAQVMAVVISG
jgi:AcrR family transcriptional regulator